MSAGFVVDPRFCGPPQSGNGGYVSGRLAAFVRTPTESQDDDPWAVEVTLRSPPPLGVRLEVTRTDDGTLLRHTLPNTTEILVAQATPVTMSAEPPAAVGYGEAVAAAQRYAGRVAHPFPTCFVCGLERAPSDGLRLEPGSVAPDVVAAAWRPDASLAGAGAGVGTEFVWAALDCPSGWATADLSGRPMVLGRMTARIVALPDVGQPYVVVGLLRALDGRKAFAASALYDADGALLAHAESTWLQIDPAAVRPAAHSATSG